MGSLREQAEAKNSIRKGKYNLITVHYENDWCTLYINGHSYYASYGEEIPDTVWLQLLELMAGVQTEIIDDVKDDDYDDDDDDDAS